MLSVDGILVKSILDGALAYRWTLMGFGKLSFDLGSDGASRYAINVWNPAFQIPNVSVLHTHPWHLESYVVAGRLVNHTYGESLPSEVGWPTHKWGWVDLDEHEVRQAFETGLYPKPTEKVGFQGLYTVGTGIIHETVAEPGTVTLIGKSGNDSRAARTFWPTSESWVSAKPRIATTSEILAFVEPALAKMKEVGYR